MSLNKGSSISSGVSSERYTLVIDIVGVLNSIIRYKNKGFRITEVASIPLYYMDVVDSNAYILPLAPPGSSRYYIAVRYDPEKDVFKVELVKSMSTELEPVYNDIPVVSFKDAMSDPDYFMKVLERYEEYVRKQLDRVVSYRVLKRVGEYSSPRKTAMVIVDELLRIASKLFKKREYRYVERFLKRMVNRYSMFLETVKMLIKTVGDV